MDGFDSISQIFSPNSINTWADIYNQLIIYNPPKITWDSANTYLNKKYKPYSITLLNSCNIQVHIKYFEEYNV